MYQNLKIVNNVEENLNKDNGLDNLFLREEKMLTNQKNLFRIYDDQL